MKPMSLSQKIKLVLDTSNMTNKCKIDVIVALIEGELQDKYECLNSKKIHQQVMSEVLYLFSRIGKDEINQTFIRERINLIRKNCWGWIAKKYQDSNLEGNQIFCAAEKEEERDANWKKITWDRFNQFYLGALNKTTKPTRREKQGRLPMI